MPEYINKQQILEKAKSLQRNLFGAVAIVREIEKADGLDLVMCSQCKHWKRICKDPLFGKDYGYCHNNDFPFMCEGRPATSEDDFCCYGERGDTE